MSLKSFFVSSLIFFKFYISWRNTVDQNHLQIHVSLLQILNWTLIIKCLVYFEDEKNRKRFLNLPIIGIRALSFPDTPFAIWESKWHFLTNMLEATLLNYRPQAVNEIRMNHFSRDFVLWQASSLPTGTAAPSTTVSWNSVTKGAFSQNRMFPWQLLSGIIILWMGLTQTTAAFMDLTK